VITRNKNTMRFTATLTGKIYHDVQEVRGCSVCPHVTREVKEGKIFLVCTHPTPAGHKRKKKLVGNWVGNYHASCPLPNDAKWFEIQNKGGL